MNFQLLEILKLLKSFLQPNLFNSNFSQIFEKTFSRNFLISCMADLFFSQSNFFRTENALIFNVFESNLLSVGAGRKKMCETFTMTAKMSIIRQ